MPRSTVPKEVRRAIRDARRMVQQGEKADANEADTRSRIERIFEKVMGYARFKHLSSEHAVRGAGETERVDFAIQIEEGKDAKPAIMVEIKRVNIDLARKHLRQVASYAINAGCEWIILTNSKEWRLYHVSFGQPPETKLIYSWNIVTDDIPLLAQRFDLISYKSIKKNALEDLWEKTNVLVPRNMLQAMLSESSMKVLRRHLRKTSGVLLAFEDVVGGIRRLLNEAALTELEGLRLSLPGRKKRTRKKKTTEAGAKPAPPETRIPRETDKPEQDIAPAIED